MVEMAKFQKQHYVAIADAVIAACDKKGIIDNLVDIFALDNPRFAAQKFREACGEAPTIIRKG